MFKINFFERFKIYLLIQIHLVFAVDISVFIGQSSAVDNLEEEMQILADELIRTVHKLVILLRVLLALLVAGGDLDLRKIKRSQEKFRRWTPLTFMSPILLPLRSVISSCSLISTM